MDDFGQAIAPQGNLGEETHINPNQVVKSGIRLIQEGLNDRGIKDLSPAIDNFVETPDNPQR